MKACQDFDAIAASSSTAMRNLSAMSVGNITTEAMCAVFAPYAETHDAASIQRCWSTRNVLCTSLYTSELMAVNPIPLVGRPKTAKVLPKGLPADSAQSCLRRSIRHPRDERATGGTRSRVDSDVPSFGLRADELLRANIGDVRRLRPPATPPPKCRHRRRSVTACSAPPQARTETTSNCDELTGWCKPPLHLPHIPGLPCARNTARRHPSAQGLVLAPRRRRRPRSGRL